MGETNGGRERAFEALRASEALHRIVLQNISDAVLKPRAVSCRPQTIRTTARRSG